ncbi:MAG: hypothetical protein ACRC2J_08540 [Microcoleaceae cyanobacterium]
MSPTILRQIWSLVENTQVTFLLALDDASLVQWLNKQLKASSSLNLNEANIVNDYIQSRLSLIRTIIEERLESECLGC